MTTYRDADWAYIDQATHRKLGAQLTRAINLKDPLKVLAAVEDALDAWEHKAWPDNWHRWNIALDDAWRAYRSTTIIDPVRQRFERAFDRMG